MYFTCHSLEREATISTADLGKERRLFTRMTEWVDLPSDSRSTTVAEVVVEESKANGLLVDDRSVTSGRLVVHAPSAKNELQSPCGGGGKEEERKTDQANSKTTATIA